MVLAALERILHGNPRSFSTVVGSVVGSSSTWERAEEVIKPYQKRVLLQPAAKKKGANRHGDCPR
jgi:hypothetical protein